MISDVDETSSSVRLVEFVKNGPNCGFYLTRGKWDPYPWVSAVDDNTVASLSGLRPGDCLLEVNGEDVVGQKISEIAEVVKSVKDKVTLLVWNAGVDPHCSPEALCCGPIPDNLKRLSACMSTILAFLECPVCLDTISPPTYQCDNGHLICIRCRAKSERCPVCRLRLARGRSLLSDQVYNAVVEAFDLKDESGDSRSQKIRQIFKPKSSKSIPIPNIKITECTSKLTSKMFSSVENLSSDTKLSMPNHTIKSKSLSSNEIFQLDAPPVSRTGSMSRLARSKRNDSTNCDFDNRSASCHGSFEFLDAHRSRGDEDNELMSYNCPYSSDCSVIIKGSDIIAHFESCHSGPLVQYFKPQIEVALRSLESETCFMISGKSNVFFVNTLALGNATDNDNDDVLLWCWHLGSKQAAKSFEMEVELKTKKSEAPLLRVRNPVLSLSDNSFLDVKEFKKGLFFSSKTITTLDGTDQYVFKISIVAVDS